MSVEKTIEAYADFLYEATVGTCEDLIMNVDTFISTGDLEDTFFYDNELAILQAVDQEMFYCAACGWNYPVADMSEHEDMVCNSCNDGE